MNKLFSYSSWKKALLLLSLSFLLQGIILWIMYPLISATQVPLDTRIGINRESVIDFYTAIGRSGRAYYFFNELILDMIFMCVYPFAYTLLLAELIKTCRMTDSGLRSVIFLPFGIAIFDFVENSQILISLNSFPVLNDTVVQIMSVANASKFCLMAVTFICGFWLLIKLSIIKIRMV